MADERNKNKTPNKSGNNNPFGNFSGTGKKRPKFSFYWIYGILALVFFAINFLNTGGEPQKTDWKHLKTMLADKDVQKLVLVNKEVAEIYLKPEALKKEAYKDVKNTTNTFGQKTPQFYYNVASPDIFIQQVQEAQKGNDNPVYVESETRHNWGGEILSWVFPIILLLGVWYFIMRMMSRGGGGAGGQIFNIGKSKAQVYDKKTSVNITFKDVAGLEEAKTEVVEVVDFLKNPDRYTRLGGKIPKGILLVGLPEPEKPYWPNR